MERSRLYKKTNSYGATAETSYALLKTQRSHHQKSYLPTSRPQYLQNKRQQELYPNTFHSFHDQFKPGRRQLQKKYELHALSKSVEDVRKQSDLLIPENRKKKIDPKSYLTTNPILNPSTYLHKSVSKQRLWSQQRKWRDNGAYSKLIFQQWKY